MPWPEWLGSIIIEGLQKSNVILLRKQTSAYPLILDQENEELAKRVVVIYRLLQLSGVLRYQRAKLLKGGCSHSQHSLRQIDQAEMFYVTHGSSPVPLTLDRLIEASRDTDVLFEISAGSEYRRLRRGLRVLLNGLGEREMQERHHQFVRSMEALILPEIGKTKRQFLNRCQTFTKGDPIDREILEDAFEMRNDTEHLHDWNRALQKYPEAEREKVSFQRTMQMEKLASLAYLRIFESVAVRANFKEDHALANFWSLDEGDRKSIWGPPLDMQMIDQDELDL